MSGQRARHAGSELGIVEELIDEHFRVDCTLIQIDAETWAIHGTIAVDGNVILAEFSNQQDAQTAIEQLSAAEHRAADPSRRSCFS